MEVLMLMSAVPMVLWLGARQAARIERRDARLLPRTGPRLERRPPALGPVHPAEIASVAVVDGELLLELVSVSEGEATRANYWLNARPDAAAIEVAEHCCAHHSLIRYCVADSEVVLVEIGGSILPMLRFAPRPESHSS